MAAEIIERPRTEAGFDFDQPVEIIARFRAVMTPGSYLAFAHHLRGFEMFGPGVAPIRDRLGRDLPPTRLTVLGGVCRKR
ncbi:MULTISPECIES: hypothetical protein [unclassified Nocardia]|uniref:hypothetical protein n=1 Tax=unclassified Nocardia TaxID=2637762 RepID=UPI001CE4409A|nr:MULTISPECIES: hypothetical protein [unclassified Nocardia]